MGRVWPRWFFYTLCRVFLCLGLCNFNTDSSKFKSWLVCKEINNISVTIIFRGQAVAQGKHEELGKRERRHNTERDRSVGQTSAPVCSAEASLDTVLFFFYPFGETSLTPQIVQTSWCNITPCQTTTMTKAQPTLQFKIPSLYICW